MNVQSIAFPKHDWTLYEMESWLARHGYHPMKAEETVSFVRFRIRSPNVRGVYATKVLPNGIRLIMMKT